MKRLVFQYHQSTSGVCCFLDGLYFVIKDGALADPKVAETLAACDSHGSFASLEIDEPADLWWELLAIVTDIEGTATIRRL